MSIRSLLAQLKSVLTRDEYIAPFDSEYEPWHYDISQHQWFCQHGQVRCDTCGPSDKLVELAREDLERRTE